MRWKMLVPLILISCLAAQHFRAENAVGQMLAPPKLPANLGPAKGPAMPPGPPPPAGPAQGPSQLTQLGKLIFFDARLSTPAGQSCAGCHAPVVGFTFPNTAVNAQLGVAPGAVAGRFGNRKVPTVSYASFSPNGPTFNANFQAFAGGQFWDGRAANLVAQAPAPLFNPNEMNNIAHNLAAPALVVQSIATGPYAKLFQQVFGANVFTLPPQQVIPLVAQAVAAWESTPEVSPFSSKYDAMLAGLVQFTPSEINGLRLATGSITGRPGGPPTKSAQCVQCHGIPAVPGAGRDLWTFFGYANTGVPRNPNNPIYTQTNPQTNPLGFNPLGTNYVDHGLGGFLYSASNLPAGNIGAGSNGKGDYLAVNGVFKTPTLRNVDKRPNPNFVRAYGHNGVFKSLEQVVHFYNTRNLTTQPGEVIDFTQPTPFAGLTGKPFWPPPEVASPVTLRNPAGMAGQIGNLGLTPQEEGDLVAFLRTLSDGP